MDWTKRAQYGDKWYTVVKTVTKLGLP